MKISAFDPGITTGIIFLDLNTTVSPPSVTLKIAAEAFLDPSLMHEDLLQKARAIAYESDLILIERPPDRAPNPVQGIAHMISDACLDNGKFPVFISPGLWKPFVKAQKWSSSTTHSVHVNDAYHMLRYYVMVKMKTILPELRNLS